MTRAESYRLLGLKPGASEADIRRQYKRMALKVHPDLNPDPRANEQFIQLTRAMEILLNPEPQPIYTHERHAARKSGTPETEAEKKKRMEEAKRRYEQQKARKLYEELYYFNQLTSGRRWMIFKWILRGSWVFALALILDTVLPTHLEKDEIVAYSTSEHNGILYEKISTVRFRNNGDFFLENRRGNWLNTYTDVWIEKTWILHTPRTLYTNDDFELFKTGFDFHLGAIRWFMVALMLVPLFTYLRRRRSLTFVFLYQFSFWAVGGILLYLLLTQNRLTHLLTLGFF